MDPLQYLNQPLFGTHNLRWSAFVSKLYILEHCSAALCNMSCLVLSTCYTPQCRMVRARGSFITREQKLIEWSNTASVMPPRAAALHIITSPCLVNKIALTDYFIVTHRSCGDQINLTTNHPKGQSKEQRNIVQLCTTFIADSALLQGQVLAARLLCLNILFHTD